MSNPLNQTLWDAIDAEDDSATRAALADRADPTALMPSGLAPIHHIVQEDGDPCLVVALLDYQPDLVHQTDAEGNTPLHRAAHHSASMVNLILERGADIFACNAAGEDAVDVLLGLEGPERLDMLYAFQDACQKKVEESEAEVAFLRAAVEREAIWNPRSYWLS